MEDRRDILNSCDPWLLVSSLTIVIFGLIMLASASVDLSSQEFHWPFHFLLRQVMYLAIGVVLIAIVTQLKVALWEEQGMRLLFLGTALLVAVLIPHLGEHANGSARWVGIGPVRIQASEFMKFAMIVFMAGYLVRRDDEIRTEISGFIKPMVVLGVISLLLLLEPDFGSVVVITTAVLTMMFMAGMQARHFVVLVLAIAIAFVLLVVLESYRLSRVTEFLNPWADPYGKTYQLVNSLLSFGRGGIFGLGLGNSVQKLSYLPEADTDFIFSVIAEELGLVGCLALIALFVVFVSRIFLVGKRAQMINENFGAYIAYGIAVWFGMQFMVNMGVDMGALPTKGLTLPFISYGGSSLVVNCLAIGLVFRIDYEARMIKSAIKSKRV